MALIKKFRIKSFKKQEQILKLDKISMFYNKRQILNNLNLEINKQEILGMLGPNGVGKSTIFHIITGLKDPSFGKVLINGVDCTNIPIYERATKFKNRLRTTIWRIHTRLNINGEFKIGRRNSYKKKRSENEKLRKLSLNLNSILCLK